MRGRTTSTRTAALAWLPVLLGAVLVSLWTARADAQTDPLPDDPSAIGDVELGSQLYALNCAQCHASNGLGAEVGNTGREAPALADNPEVTAAYVDLTMRVGRMPPPESPFDNQPREVAFTPEQRLAIVAFTIAEFGVENDLFAVEPGDPARGQQLWASNCAACHGSTGQGGVAGGGAWTPAVAPLDPVTIGEAILVGPFQMPAFDGEQISDEGIADIAAFMHEVNEEQGTPLGLVELNPVFASGFVALLALVMTLSLLWISGKPTWFPDPDAPPGAEGQGDTQPDGVKAAVEKDPAVEEGRADE